MTDTKMVPFQWQDESGTVNVMEIPEGMYHAIMRAFGKATVEQIATTMTGVEDRLQTIHPKMLKDDGYICAKCGTNYPCKEVRIIMGYEPDEGIVIETKEGGIAHTMKQGESGVEAKEDEDGLRPSSDD